MEERRFDDLTRTLGRATTRRGVLKGLVGGLVAVLAGRSLGAPDAAAAGCNVAHCKDAAYHEWAAYEQSTCNNLCHDRHLFLACFGCRMNAGRLLQKWLHDCEHGDGCLGQANEVCCGGVCAHVDSDPNNCGACGNVCPPGNDCVHGQCQCGEHGIVCDGQCVDPRIDAKHCGSCDHACGTCETCDNGQCVDVECGDGKICCQDQCVDLCSGEPPNPTTCQCDNCQGQFDGAACGTNEVCCQEQCLSSQCPSPKQFSLDTCNCQCPPANCPTGQRQDPDTCQCVDLCANVTCGECETCDPTSGDCVQADDQTPCGDGQVCCGGTCQNSCGCTPSQCQGGGEICCTGAGGYTYCCYETQVCCDSANGCCWT